MRQLLTTLALVIATSVVGQSQWGCIKDGNPFDGYLKIASIKSYSSQSYEQSNQISRLTIELFKNSKGDTIITFTPYSSSFSIAVNGNKYHFSDTDTKHVYEGSHISTCIFTAVIDGEFKMKMLPLRDVINELKLGSSFQVRMGDKIADYKFTLKGSSAAIDCALK